MFRPGLLHLCFLAALTGITAGNAFAQATEDRGAAREREMLRRLQDLTRTSAEEKSQLNSEIEELKKKLQGAEQGSVQAGKKSRETEKAIAGLRERGAMLEKEKSEISARLAQVQRVLEQTQASLVVAQQKLREAGSGLERATQLQDAQKSELTDARAVIAQRDREIESCEIKNRNLYEYNVDLLGRFGTSGFCETLRKVKPAAGLKSVAIENLIEEYRDKLEAEQIVARRPAKN